MYGSSRLTYHHGARSTSVRLHVSASKNVDVEPSTAFWGIPPSATELCIGALPAATLSTGTKNNAESSFRGFLQKMRPFSALFRVFGLVRSTGRVVGGYAVRTLYLNYSSSHSEDCHAYQTTTTNERTDNVFCSVFENGHFAF